MCVWFSKMFECNLFLIVFFSVFNFFNFQHALTIHYKVLYEVGSEWGACSGGGNVFQVSALWLEIEFEAAASRGMLQKCIYCACSSCHFTVLNSDGHLFLFLACADAQVCLGTQLPFAGVSELVQFVLHLQPTQ